MSGTFLRGDDCDGSALRLVVVQEVGGARRVEILAVERRLLSAVAAQRRDLIEQVTRMAGAQRAVRRLIVPAMQICRHHRMEHHVSAAAVHLENAT